MNTENSCIKDKIPQIINILNTNNKFLFIRLTEWIIRYLINLLNKKKFFFYFKDIFI